MNEFDSIWDTLAKHGHCDARGSAEYDRVKRAWERFGFFNSLLNFIINSANRLPDQKTDAQDRASGTNANTSG